jgi:dihydrofolate synthase/folylpolyglutamate synthase
LRMDYLEALKFLEGRRSMGMKPGLERVRALLDCFDNPQEDLYAVHVTGTNGKGSVCAFLENIYHLNGYRTGLFSSTFLLSPTEMFRINGTTIEPQALAELISRAAAYCRQLDDKQLGPTEYEIYTAIALAFFRDQGCDLAIMEVGMGGTWDCTNILTRKAASVITKISYDHTEYLGKTLSEIAKHKAGIIAPGVPVISWPQEPEAMAVIREVSEVSGSPLSVPSFDSIHITALDKRGSRFKYEDTSFHAGMLGEHQVYNAIMAYTTVMAISDRFPVDPERVLKGISTMSWPGRFELLRQNPDFILDCAHNPDGVSAFIQTYKALYGRRKATLIFGVMRDKAYQEMLRLLSEIAEAFILVRPNNARALSLEELKESADIYCEKVTKSDTIDSAISTALHKVKKDGIICALGSIYYAGSLRDALIHIG